MDEPQKIPMFEYTKDDPKQLRLWPAEEVYEHEDYNKNNSQSIPELDSNEID